MIERKTLTLKNNAKLPNGTEIGAGQKIEIIMDVVYIGPGPIPGTEQATVLTWIKENPSLFK